MKSYKLGSLSDAKAFLYGAVEYEYPHASEREIKLAVRELIERYHSSLTFEETK